MNVSERYKRSPQTLQNSIMFRTETPCISLMVPVPAHTPTSNQGETRTKTSLFYLVLGEKRQTSQNPNKFLRFTCWCFAKDLSKTLQKKEHQ